MGTLKIRKDRTPAMLRKLAKAESDVRVALRLLAIANALCGMSRAEAAHSAGMDRQTLRDWVVRYNEHGVAGLTDAWKGGRPPMLTMDEQAELLAIVMGGPDRAPTGAKMMAASSGTGGASPDPPAQAQPNRSANACASASP